MRSRFAWLLAGLGAVVAAARFLRRPATRPPVEVEPEGEPDPRAGDLRRRIEESKSLVDEREAFEEAETPLDEADPEARRRQVHERGRAAVERMHDSGPTE